METPFERVVKLCALLEQEHGMNVVPASNPESPQWFEVSGKGSTTFNISVYKGRILINTIMPDDVVLSSSFYSIELAAYYILKMINK